jgi:hypothetical protein
MAKVINQIRDIEIIENELKTAIAGLLSYPVTDEKITQFPTTFVYLDKNVYIFFEDESELYDQIHADALSTFSVIKTEKGKKSAEVSFVPAYKFIAVKLFGINKKIEEQKTIDDLNKLYVEKYLKSDLKKKYKKILMIDTEEIQASEEIGG